MKQFTLRKLFAVTAFLAVEFGILVPFVRNGRAAVVTCSALTIPIGGAAGALAFSCISSRAAWLGAVLGILVQFCILVFEVHRYVGR